MQSPASLVAEAEAALKSERVAVGLDLLESAAQMATDQKTRARALERLERAAKEAGLPDRAKRAAAARERDGKVQRVLDDLSSVSKKPQKALALLDEAAAAYGADRDEPHAAWARAIKARVLVTSGSGAEGLALARRVLEAKPTALGKQVAINAALRASADAKDIEGEATYALMLNALETESLATDVRRYTRGAAAQSVCDRYEKAKGDGACGVLSGRVLGEYNLRDRSIGATRQELSDDDIERSHSEYLPLIEDCLYSAAKRPENSDLFEDAEVSVAWSVGNDGRVLDPEISPRRFDPVLGPCVKERLAWFRYPRYRDKDRKSVRVPYSLRETTRMELVETP